MTKSKREEKTPTAFWSAASSLSLYWTTSWVSMRMRRCALGSSCSNKRRWETLHSSRWSGTCRGGSVCLSSTMHSLEVAGLSVHAWCLNFAVRVRDCGRGIIAFDRRFGTNTYVLLRTSGAIVLVAPRSGFAPTFLVTVHTSAAPSSHPFPGAFNCALPRFLHAAPGDIGVSTLSGPPRTVGGPCCAQQDSG